MQNIILTVCGLLKYPLNEKICTEQYEQNLVEWKKLRIKSYIDNQEKLSSLTYGKAGRLSERILFGGKKMTAASNSCEVIAAYNALLYLGDANTLPDLLLLFSKNGIVFGGRFGTYPPSIKNAFDVKKYELAELCGNGLNEEKINALQDKYEAFIFTSLNEAKNIFSMVHTMFVEKGKHFKIHNDYEGNKSYKSLFEAVSGYNNVKGKLLYILGVKRR